jgi:demethoxyubiquinone hydroxylase (CLK1/Coq7/Cat5 family)
VERFTGFVERKKPGMLGNAVQSQQDWLDMFNQFIADKEGLPKVLRKLIKHYSQKVGIAQAIGVSASQSGGKITTQQLSDSVAGQISDKIDAMGQLPSAWWFWGIAAGQIVFFFVMKYFVT